MIDENTTVTARELAALLGLTDRRIRQLAEDGTFERVDRGRYRLAQCVQAFVGAAESRADSDELRAARIALMDAQKRRIEQDLADRQGTEQQLDSQDGLIEALGLEAQIRMRRIATWIYHDLQGRDCTIPGVPDAARYVGGQVEQWIVGIRHELQRDFRQFAASARQRQIIIQRHADLRRQPEDE